MRVSKRILVTMLLIAAAGSAWAQSDALVQLQNQVESLYARLSPSVVNITNNAIVTNQFMQAAPEQGTGSGFFWDRSGLIVTNYHVVANEQSLTVTLASGQTYDATVVGSDPTNDLAVIRVNASGLPEPLSLADASTVKVGEFVIAIGNPFGLQRTLTFGVVSALGRTIQSPNNRFIGEAIQTDTAINPGNSGGPLIDMTGKVIGVNSQILSPSGTNSGIGFAISSATVARVVPELIAHGRYAHPSLGIQAMDFSSDLADVLKQAGQTVGNVTAGVYVVAVSSGSGAERAGIRGGSRTISVGQSQLPVGGDVITSVDGQPVTSVGDLIAYLDAHASVGQTVSVTLNRDGRSMTVQVKLGELPAQQQ